MLRHLHIGKGARHLRVNISKTGRGIHIRGHKKGHGIHKLKHAIHMSSSLRDGEPESSNLQKLRHSLKRLNIGHGQKTKYISF